MLRDHCIIFWRKREGMIWFNIICFKFCRFERITWWCLSALEFGVRSALQSILKIVLLEKYKNNHGLPEFALDPPLGGGPDENFKRSWNLIYSPPCKTPCRLFIHEVFFGSLDLHLRVWSELAPKTFFGSKGFNAKWDPNLPLGALEGPSSNHNPLEPIAKLESMFLMWNEI